MSTAHKKQRVRERARSIKKASKGKLTTKDYLQRALVVLIIVVILIGALYLTDNIS